MGKWIICLLAAMVVAVLLKLLNAYILKYEIPDFSIGWISCIVWFSTRTSLEKHWE